MCVVTFKICTFAGLHIKIYAAYKHLGKIMDLDTAVMCQNCVNSTRLF